MKRLQGFSLMEMMIVLTIVAIVAAASAPMVNKKMVRAASEKSPWVFTNGESIGYNIDNENGIQDRKTATIGANGRVPNTGGNPRLYIDTNSDTTPHILFGRRGGNLIRLIAGGDNNNIWFSNANIPAGLSKSVAIGTDIGAADLFGCVSIGDSSEVRGSTAVAIGGQTSASVNSVAIGRQSRALNDDTIAVGNNAVADTELSVAIGSEAKATDVGGVAIGYTSEATNASIGINGKANGGSSIAIGGEAGSSANNAVVVGTGASTNKISAIAIGPKASANGNEAIAIGNYSTSSTTGNSVSAAGSKSIAIGCGAKTTEDSASSIGIGTNAWASKTNSIAIGTSAWAFKDGSIAIGSGAHSTHESSVAIGHLAKTTAANQIVLGTSISTVYIPGNLVVGNTTVLGARSNGSYTYIREENGSGHRYLYRIGQAYDKVDRQGNRGSITAFNISHPGKITVGEMEIEATSDRRLKNIGKEFKAGLAELKKLDLYHYTYKEDDRKTPHVGVMAQDLQKIFPDAVVKGEDGFLRIRMEDMFYTVINAVKELDIRITAQEKKIQELEKRIEELEKLVKQS